MDMGVPVTGELAIDGPIDRPGHETATHVALARYLAGLLGLDFVADAPRQERPRYLVPKATLIGKDEAARLGITGPGDLFGGWVPYDWMATKAIAHGLMGSDAGRLPGWSDDLASHAGDLTLRGFTACSRRGAEEAGRLLLERGAIRLKPIHADGARGQHVVKSLDDLPAILDQLSDGEELTDPVVIEENLEDVETYSVGIIAIGGHLLTYCGTQSLTGDNHGDSVYGGSELLVANGAFETLLRQDLPQPFGEVVAVAREFDRLADAHLPPFIASRRNYDIVLGRDAEGAKRLAVLEQSWRVGGASFAELIALDAFKANPDLKAVRSRTVERYGGTETAPEGAKIYFQGNDPVVGQLLKYATVDTHIDAGAQDRH